jgi:hypothetical protein
MDRTANCAVSGPDGQAHPILIPTDSADTAGNRFSQCLASKFVAAHLFRLPLLSSILETPQKPLLHGVNRDEWPMLPTNEVSAATGLRCNSPCRCLSHTMDVFTHTKMVADPMPLGRLILPQIQLRSEKKFSAPPIDFNPQVWTNYNEIKEDWGTMNNKSTGNYRAGKR